jgi:hypothetical protein
VEEPGAGINIGGEGEKSRGVGVVEAREVELGGRGVLEVKWSRESVCGAIRVKVGGPMMWRGSCLARWQRRQRGTRVRESIAHGPCRRGGAVGPKRR